MEKQKGQSKESGCLPVLRGRGLNFINFSTMVKSLPLEWISRVRGDTDDSWKVIPNYYYSAWSDVQFLLKCIYDTETINKCLPNFYRELLQYFQEFKYKTNIFPFQTQQLSTSGEEQSMHNPDLMTVQTQS